MVSSKNQAPAANCGPGRSPRRTQHFARANRHLEPRVVANEVLQVDLQSSGNRNTHANMEQFPQLGLIEGSHEGDEILLVLFDQAQMTRTVATPLNFGSTFRA